MDIEFDPAKDGSNIAKHGVSFELAAAVLESVLSDDVEYVRGEERIVAFGLYGLTVYVCIYTLRGETRRIIPLRKATKKEVKTRWR